MAAQEAPVFLVLLLLLACAHGMAVSNLESSLGYLEQYGYLPERSPERPTFSSEEIQGALRHFQQFVKLPESGELDENTVAMMRKPRCGNPDVMRSESETGTVSNFNRAGEARWNMTDYPITYRVSGYSQNLPQDVQDTVIADALRLWSDVAIIDFQEIFSGTPDFDIFFQGRAHGDGFDFDGEGGVLAHAFFPQNSRQSDLPGDAHFDDDEQWTIGNAGFDLGTVAAHEFGHSIGLAHSDNDAALMAPFYAYNGPVTLHPDDITGAQFIYGVRPGAPTFPPTTPSATTPSATNPPTTTPPATNPPATNPPNPSGPHCNVKFQGMFEGAQGTVFAFSGDKVYTITINGDIQDYPLGANWFLAPNDAGAVVFDVRNGDMFFMKGSTYRTYNTQHYSRSFGYIPQGWPLYDKPLVNFEDPTGAIQWETDQIFLFHGDYYTRWQDGQLDHTASYPRPIKNFWSEAPDSPDAVVHVTFEGFTYFFKDGNYYKFNTAGQLMSGYPRDMGAAWLGCGSFQPR